jgi:TolB-like protein/tetratricopeptide (TPR) repeat protein
LSGESGSAPGAAVTGPAVFLSYASEDAAAAQRLCDALCAAGIEMWFDKSELRGGDAWDAAIRRQIKGCALFIPIISTNAHARTEGYFRLEWKLAVDRSHLMAPDKPFLLPVAIDDTPQSDERIPDRFRELQWTRLPGGETPPAFVERVKRLLFPAAAREASHAALGGVGGAPSGSALPSAGRTASAEAAPGGSRSTLRALIWAVALIVVVAIVMYYGTQWSASHGTAQPSAGAPATPVAAQGKSVAVLPFTDLSEKHDQEYFSDGLAEELIDTLTQVPNLRVPARTSSFSFKGKAVTVSEIGRALGVTHILEGSVRKSGERLRITAQLVRADNGFHLWSQTYDRDARDIFAVQDDIARAVSEQLQSTLMGTQAAAPQQSTSPEAYTLYLQARHLATNDTRQDLVQAQTLYHRALELDPNYAPAWVGLAFCLGRQVAQGSVGADGAGASPQWYASQHAGIVAAANHAIALNPNLPDAYVAAATTYIQYDLNWSAAAEALAKARALDPNNVEMLALYGHLTAATGQPGEAAEYFRRAMQGDPLNLLHRKYLGRALHYAGHSAESAEVLRRAIALDTHFPGLHYELGRALLVSQDAAAASAAFAAEPAETSSWRVLGLPLGYHATGDTTRAKAALADLLANSQGAEFQVAEAVAFFGDRDGALQWLEKARLNHDPGVVWVRHDALLASIAGDPRFAAYLKRLGQPPN